MFIHAPLYKAIETAVMLCGWEGNYRSHIIVVSPKYILKVDMVDDHPATKV